MYFLKIHYTKKNAVKQRSTAKRCKLNIKAHKRDNISKIIIPDLNKSGQQAQNLHFLSS